MSRKVPRLEFDDLEPKLAETLRPRVERLKYLGEFFRVAGHNPDVLRPFMEMTEALKEALPNNLTEVGALTVAGHLRNDYERNQHEKLSLKLGFSKDWIRAVNALSPDEQTELAEDEKLAQLLALTLLAYDWKAARPLFDRLIDTAGHQQASAFLMLVGRYMTHALVVNVFDLAPPVPSVFDEEPATP